MEQNRVTGVDKTGHRVRKMFGEIAPRYDLLNHLLSLNVDRYWRWQTVRHAGPQGKEPILDVCTGTGDLALAYYRATDGQVPVVASDFCLEMLQHGEEKKRRRGINGNLSFVEADTEQLPFDDESFQLVTVAFGLRNVSDTARGLAEMVRVCRETGRVAVLEFSMPERQPLKAVYSNYFRYVLPRVGQLLSRNQEEAYNYLPASVAEFPSGSALVEKMEEAGLEKVTCQPLTMGIASLYIGHKAASEDLATRAAQPAATSNA